MLKRYTTNAKGRLIKQADVYLPEEHGIKRTMIDPEALRICERLKRAGYEAYIVGGAIRDMILGLSPKDFDIATDAYPGQAKRACRSARVIGRRFPLVHAFGYSGRIFEVATFRSLEPKEDGNIFGSLYEDAFRRDFTMNALYYDPETEHLLDFHHSVRHIKQAKLVPVIPLPQSFIEDPVRMIRAAKYSVTTHTRIPFKLGRTIKQQAHLLQTCSLSRLADEVKKVLQNNKAFDILLAFHQYGLLDYLLPELHNNLSHLPKAQQLAFYQSLKSKQTDAHYYSPTEILQCLFEGYLERRGVLQVDNLDQAMRTLKQGLAPLVFPNVQVQQVVELIFTKRKLRFYPPDIVPYSKVSL